MTPNQSHVAGLELALDEMHDMLDGSCESRLNRLIAEAKSTMMGLSDTGKYVLTTDYARLEQECERLSNELNNMRISWGLMQSEREAALKQVERLTAMLHRASKAESRPEFTQIIAAALSAKP